MHLLLFLKVKLLLNDNLFFDKQYSVFYCLTDSSHVENFQTIGIINAFYRWQRRIFTSMNDLKTIKTR